MPVLQSPPVYMTTMQQLLGPHVLDRSSAASPTAYSSYSSHADSVSMRATSGTYIKWKQKNEVFGMQRSGNLYLARIYILTWSKFLLGNHPNKFGASRVRLPNLFLESLDSMATFPYARPAQVLAWTKIRFPTRQNRAIPKKLLGRLLGLLWLFSFSGRRLGTSTTLLRFRSFSGIARLRLHTPRILLFVLLGIPGQRKRKM